MKRDEALEILSKEGVLLVLCSLIDNMPYVVAEAAVGAFAPFCFHCFRTWARIQQLRSPGVKKATVTDSGPLPQVKGIPFLVFDVGGVLEMFDEADNTDAVVKEPTLDSLYSKLHGEILASLLLLTHAAPKSETSETIVNQSWLVGRSSRAMAWAGAARVADVQCFCCAGTMIRGALKTVNLSTRVTTGKEQWLDWHAHFAESRISKLQQACSRSRHARSSSANHQHPLQPDHSDEGAADIPMLLTAGCVPCGVICFM